MKKIQLDKAASSTVMPASKSSTDLQFPSSIGSPVRSQSLLSPSGETEAFRIHWVIKSNKKQQQWAATQLWKSPLQNTKSWEWRAALPHPWDYFNGMFMNSSQTPFRRVNREVLGERSTISSLKATYEERSHGQSGGHHSVRATQSFNINS